MANTYTGLLTGSHWSGIEVYGKSTIVTYSFPTLATKPAYLATLSDPNLTPAALATYQGFTAAEQTLARAALAEWGNNSGLIFLEVAAGQGDIQFHKIDFSGTGYDGYGGIGYRPFGAWDFLSYPYFSGDLDSSGDVFMNSDVPVTSALLLHEIGHALGLKHPTEAWTQYAAEPDVVHDVWSADINSLTIMSEIPGGAQVLTPIDIQAIQAIYGTNAQDGTQVAAWSWSATKQTLTQTGFATADAIRGTSVIDVIKGMDGDDRLFGLAGNDTLYGNAGNDTLDGGAGNDKMYGGTGDDVYMLSAKTDKVIELAGEGFDTVYSAVTATLAANVEVLYVLGNANVIATGNAGDNQIYGGAGNGTLKGMDGADYIVGNTGKDKITGGAGGDYVFGMGNADTFVFANLTDFGAGGAIDAIGDFSHAEGDRIDLRTIDPDPVATGNQAFSFVGTAAFTTDTRFQVRYDTAGSSAVVQIDVNHDRVADHSLILYNVASLVAADFVL